MRLIPPEAWPVARRIARARYAAAPGGRPGIHRRPCTAAPAILACRKTAKAVKRRYRSRGALAHVVTISAYRRSLAIGAMRAAGVGDLGYGDPISWERARRA